MSGDSVVEAVGKFRELEELHLTLRPCIAAADIEVIGNSCPKLISFSYNGMEDDDSSYDDSSDDDFGEVYNPNGYALAIGRSMPNLLHLQLFDHWMQNEGLESILNGCPHLKSLDIRQCLGLNLGEDLGKRCRQQIKDLRLPHDSVSDVPWLEWHRSDMFTGYSHTYY